ncbi:alpha-ketoglutarate-dependent dioxygenase AlkB [Chryseobacterium sp. 1B4]
MFSLKQRIEKEFGCQFNGVLLNLYRDHNDSVAWHRDKESRYGKRPVIASISLGQTRNFDFRKKITIRVNTVCHFLIAHYLS